MLTSRNGFTLGIQAFVWNPTIFPSVLTLIHWLRSPLFLSLLGGFASWIAQGPNPHRLATIDSIINAEVCESKSKAEDDRSFGGSGAASSGSAVSALRAFLSLDVSHRAAALVRAKSLRAQSGKCVVVTLVMLEAILLIESVFLV